MYTLGESRIAFKTLDAVLHEALSDFDTERLAIRNPEELEELADTIPPVKS